MKNKILIIVCVIAVIIILGLLKFSTECKEPNNPFPAGSGSSMGYEWAESGHSCEGDEDAFFDGCMEYKKRAKAYYSCL